MFHSTRYTLRSGFSLIEIMVGIMIMSLITIAAFQTLSLVGISKIRIVEKTSIEKESFFAAEKLFELIKTGGTIDYEEYFNRKSINDTGATLYSSGHYALESGFGNYGVGGSVGGSIGEGIYCMSTSGTNMGTGGCIGTGHSFNASGSFLSVGSGSQLLYGTYREQFIDYNSDLDSDFGNEDGSTGRENFVGDDDDVFLGIGPEALVGSGSVKELYLINTNSHTRTYFRHRVELDPDAPATETCTGTEFMTGSGCLGTIEILRLNGVDVGRNHGVHNGASSDYWSNDGKIDTWLIDDDFVPTVQTVDKIFAGEDGNSYWQSIFSDEIHVSNVEFFVFPNKSSEYSWRDNDISLQLSPYVQVQLTLKPSWKVRKRLRGEIPEVTIRNTISLSEINYK